MPRGKVEEQIKGLENDTARTEERQNYCECWTAHIRASAFLRSSWLEIGEGEWEGGYILNRGQERGRGGG